MMLLLGYIGKKSPVFGWFLLVSVSFCCVFHDSCWGKHLPFMLISSCMAHISSVSFLFFTWWLKGNNVDVAACVVSSS